MGLPTDLTPTQVEALTGLTEDTPEFSIDLIVNASGRLEHRFPVHQNDLVLVTIKRE
jgi:hypothetical protein